jgi:L-ascorbate metabolism protein UlaG (beta-lactamase superfamily)
MAMEGNRWPRSAAIALAVVWIAACGGGDGPLPVDEKWEVPGSQDIPPGSITVRWTGTATLVFSDGETTWMTDGWFTRPSGLALLWKIGPDPDAIERGLASNGVDKLSAVFPVHSHYDHAMDAAEVARRTGALLLGSESTANIGRGAKLPEQQIRVVHDREILLVGKFAIRPIVSRHFEFPNWIARKVMLGSAITEPLEPPAWVWNYAVGETYVLHVAHPKGSFLVVGSAGYLEGALDGFQADVAFLGVGGLGSQTADYQQAYWRETVERVHATRVIPIHWDSLTSPIEGPFRGSGSSDGETRFFLKKKEAENPGIAFQTLPRYEPVVLF